MQHDYSLLTLLQQLSKWRKTIYYTTAAAAILSLIISLLLPVYYKASTTFYAASETLSSPSPVGGTDKSYYIYGTKDDRDRLLSISQSGTVFDHLINSFGLYDIYGIDSTSLKGPFLVRKKLSDLYSAQKTEFGGIEIIIEDEDRFRASDMANSAREKISAIVQSMIKESQQKMIDNLRHNISTKEQLITVTDDTLRRLRARYEIYDTKTQGALFAELMTNTAANINELEGKISSIKTNVAPRDSLRKWRAQLSGLTSKKEQITGDLGNYSDGLATVMKVEQELARYTTQITVDKERLNQLQATYDAPFTSLHIIERAHPPVIKSRPKKAIVILASTLAVFMLTVLAVLIAEAYKQVPWDQINTPPA